MVRKKLNLTVSKGQFFDYRRGGPADSSPFLVAYLFRIKVFPLSVTIRIGEDHALVEEFLEGLFRADVARVIEHLEPEARVEKVQDRVFGAADVEVDGEMSQSRKR